MIFAANDQPTLVRQLWTSQNVGVWSVWYMYNIYIFFFSIIFRGVAFSLIKMFFLHLFCCIVIDPCDLKFFCVSEFRSWLCCEADGVACSADIKLLVAYDMNGFDMSGIALTVLQYVMVITTSILKHASGSILCPASGLHLRSFTASMPWQSEFQFLKTHRCCKVVFVSGQHHRGGEFVLACMRIQNLWICPDLSAHFPYMTRSSRKANRRPSSRTAY